MTTITFGAQQAYSDEAIIVDVDVTTPAGPLPCKAIIDTGAWTTCFDRAIAPLLGIADLTTGKEVPMTPASGIETKGYAFPVEVTLLGRILTIPVVFVPSWPEGTLNLLGMRGFLDQFGCIAVDHGQKLFHHS